MHMSLTFYEEKKKLKIRNMNLLRKICFHILYFLNSFPSIDVLEYGWAVENKYLIAGHMYSYVYGCLPIIIVNS